MNDFISLNHGSGGKLTMSLLKRFCKKVRYVGALTDSFIIKESGSTLALTTDSYVVDPLFFPEAILVNWQYAEQ